MKAGTLFCIAASFIAAGCASNPARAKLPELEIPTVNITASRAFESYTPIPPEAAIILGCSTAPSLPICEVSPPSVEEDSAFQAESVRLVAHQEPRCRELGAAIAANRERIRMYRKALIRESDNGRLYGVGHTYELGSEWMVRVARRIDDLNDRTLEEKKRTLRHEVSHTIGATESSGELWSAEEFATRCS